MCVFIRSGLKLVAVFLAIVVSGASLSVAFAPATINFDDVADKTSWKQFARLPAFNDVNRGNAYNTYLLMEKELLK